MLQKGADKSRISNPAITEWLARVRATRRVLNQPWGRLGWLLEFAQLTRRDFGRLDPSERAKVVEEIEAFVPGPIVAQKSALVSTAKLAEMAATMRYGIERIADRKCWKLRVSAMSDLVLFCTPRPKMRSPMGGMPLIEPGLEHGTNPAAAKALKKLLKEDASIRVKADRGRSIVPRWGGKLRTRLLMAAVDLLEAEGDRIRRCLSCGKLFVRRKRGAYCSTACSTKTRSALFRMRHREELRKNRIEYYDQKIKRKYGDQALRRLRERRRKNDPNQREESNGKQTRTE
jgi:hypothetical protein